MDLLNRLYSLIYHRYQAMTPGARAYGLLAVVAAAGLAYMLACPASVPDVELLPGMSLAPNQMSAMVAALADANLKDCSTRGTKIYVPQNRVTEYLAVLANAKAMPAPLGNAQREALSNGSAWEVGSQRDLHFAQAVVVGGTDADTIVRLMDELGRGDQLGAADGEHGVARASRTGHQAVGEHCVSDVRV